MQKEVIADLTDQQLKGKIRKTNLLGNVMIALALWVWCANSFWYICLWCIYRTNKTDYFSPEYATCGIGMYLAGLLLMICSTPALMSKKIRLGIWVMLGINFLISSTIIGTIFAKIPPEGGGILDIDRRTGAFLVMTLLPYVIILVLSLLFKTYYLHRGDMIAEKKARVTKALSSIDLLSLQKIHKFALRSITSSGIFCCWLIALILLLIFAVENVIYRLDFFIFFGTLIVILYALYGAIGTVLRKKLERKLNWTFSPTFTLLSKEVKNRKNLNSLNNSETK